MVEGIAEGMVLRLVPAGAEPEDQPAAGDLLDRVRHLGQQGRVAETGATDQRADLDPLGDGRHAAQQRPAFPGAQVSVVAGESAIKQEMIRNPERVESGRFRLAGKHRQQSVQRGEAFCIIRSIKGMNSPTLRGRDDADTQSS